MVVFLGCVKKKANRKTIAENMYCSDLFLKSLKYAKSLNPRKIYILSAKYGLLNLKDKIEPYEQTLNNFNIAERKEWSKKIITQLIKEKQDFSEEAVFLCGKKYRQFLQKKFINFLCPVEHLGIGKQLKFYKERNK